MTTKHDSYYTSRGDPHPVATMIHSWVFSIMLPAATLAAATTRSWTATLAAAILTPALAICQGTVAILSYRSCFGDAPLPVKPCHGVVLVSPDDDGDDNDSSPINDVTGDDKKVTGGRPLRLLVIGDSLAIGVGQRSSPTPLLPESIAKTLSKQLGGRVVYWTCHGAPGASTGWLVREVEKGVCSNNNKKKINNSTMTTDRSLKRSSTSCLTDDSEEEDEWDCLSSSEQHLVASSGDSSSEDDDSDDEPNGSFRAPAHDAVNDPDENDESQDYVNRTTNSNVNRKVTRRKRNAARDEWKAKLAQHGERFTNPDAMGPYDVVVVLTGANDLKSAFFPFLLNGDDVELRKEAQERGGCYTEELRRLVETLNVKMRSSSPRQSGFNRSDDNDNVPCRPLVVLPGMPARSLPIFQSAPLRWIAVPTVDIMDMLKRNFAEDNAEEVLFVPPPSVKDLTDFHERRGEIWDGQTNEDVRVRLQHVSEEERTRIKLSMANYYESREQNPSPVTRLCSHSSPMFSLDGVHPCDGSYDFWGRYIGETIVKELCHHSIN